MNADHKLRLPREPIQWPMRCQPVGSCGTGQHDSAQNQNEFLSFLFFKIDIYYSYNLTHTVCMSRHFDFHCRLCIRKTSTAGSVSLLKKVCLFSFSPPSARFPPASLFRFSLSQLFSHAVGKSAMRPFLPHYAENRFAEFHFFKARVRFGG